MIESRPTRKADPILQAATTARYYTELIKGGVPEDLAEDLTRDWHSALLSSVVEYHASDTGVVKVPVSAPSSIVVAEAPGPEPLPGKK